MKLPMFTCDIPLQGRMLEVFCKVLSVPPTNTCIGAHEPVNESQVAGQTIEWTRYLIDLVAEDKKICAVWYGYEFGFDKAQGLKSFAEAARGLFVRTDFLTIATGEIVRYFACKDDNRDVVALINWVENGDHLGNKVDFWVKHIVYGFVFGYDAEQIKRHLILLSKIEKYKKHGKPPINGV